MLALANPRRFLNLAAWLEPATWIAAAIVLGIGLYMALIGSPPDYQQGETVRIMFIHVPAAWVTMGIYAFMAVSSFFGLIYRHLLADLAAKAAAPIGAAFNLLTLITGSLWGRPMWGTYWVWDARLTSVLIMLFVYLGYIALWQAIEDPLKAARAAAILCLVGAINLPIIHFSVEWWNTLHQPASVLKSGGPSIYSSILWPLMVMFLGYLLLFAALEMLRIRAELLERRLRTLTGRID